MYLRVALPDPLPTLFDYLPPAAASEIRPGSRVLVPFGRGKAVGVVVATGVEPAVGAGKLKRALHLLDQAPLLDAELMQTLAWAADYWLGAPGEAYANALPLLLRNGLSTVISGTLIAPFIALVVTLIYYRLSGAPDGQGPADGTPGGGYETA